MHRQPTQPELQALSTIAIGLAALAWTWTPGLITPAVTAVLVYLATITGASRLFRWNVSHALLASSIILRHTIANLLRGATAIIQALATAALWLLNTAHTHLTTGYTTAA